MAVSYAVGFGRASGLTNTPDLDLEDLDATQLDEELVDPPDLEPAPSTSSQQASTAPPPQAQQVQPSAQQYGQSSQPAMQGQGQQDDGMAQGIDRIRPSDMPDEGLVVSILDSLIRACAQVRSSAIHRTGGSRSRRSFSLPGISR